MSQDPLLPPYDWRRMAAMLDGISSAVVAGQQLSELTTFRIGGPGGLICPVENAGQARRFLDFAHHHQLPWTCLGGGSNILADDSGFAGMILLVQTRELEVSGSMVHVGSGWDFDTLVAETLRRGLTGLEFASGIPGTVGGALVGNAGCYGQEIGNLLAEATVLRPGGELVVIGPEDFDFQYRSSALKGRGDIVLDMVLTLEHGDLHEAGRVREEHIADRQRKHPGEIPCAGSYFKNLPPLGPGERRRAAGQLLEAAGAKSMQVGDAAVFPLHANIIVNRGRARCCDVLDLAERMRRAVQEQFDVDLEPEVRHLKTPHPSQVADGD